MSRPDAVRPNVLIPGRFGPLMQLVSRGRRSRQAVFSWAYELLCFGAAVGFVKGKQGPTSLGGDDKADGGDVMMDNADRDDRVLCDMIAVAATGSDEILSAGKLQQRIDIFMEYACGGMDHMLQLVAEGRTARDAVEMIIRHNDEDSSVKELSAFIALEEHA